MPKNALSGPHAAGSRPVAEVIEPHLLRTRWFAGKNRPARLRALVPLPWLDPSTGSGGPSTTEPVEGPAVRFEIAEIEYADAQDPSDAVEYYLTALCYRSPSDPGGPGFGVAAHPELGPVAVHSAALDPGALDELLRFISADNRREDKSAGRATVLANQLIDGSTLRPGLQPHPLNADQSNTSIRYGTVALLKLFRRLEIGQNPDIEIHQRLAEGSARHRVARLYGWLEGEWTDSRGRHCLADLGMLVEQLPHVHDGWTLAVEALIAGQDFSARAGELGRALREVHAGLAQAFGRDSIRGGTQATGIRGRIARLMREVPDAAPLQDQLERRVATIDGLGYSTQRVHGDFHLGQALLAGEPGEESWRIIDFEGEPLKSLDERRLQDSPWRDVAGLLRSLAYAGDYAVRTQGVTRGYADAWVASARGAVLKAYADHELTDQERAVLHAHEIDKAVYECRYEARHRPDWLPIPLASLTTLVGRDGTDGGTR